LNCENLVPRFLYFLDKDVTEQCRWKIVQQVRALGLAFIFARYAKFRAGNIYSFLDSGVSVFSYGKRKRHVIGIDSIKASTHGKVSSNNCDKQCGE